MRSQARRKRKSRYALSLKLEALLQQTHNNNKVCAVCMV